MVGHMSGASVREVKAAYAAQLSSLAVSDWDELRAALAGVEASDSFGHWSAAVARADGTSRMAFPSLSASAEMLIRAFTQCGLQAPFEWMSWARGKALAADPGLLAKATPAEAAMVIVAQLRLDRFVDGHLLTCFDTGLIQKAVRRMLDAAPPEA
jgi:hypothetical protein